MHGICKSMAGRQQTLYTYGGRKLFIRSPGRLEELPKRASSSHGVWEHPWSHIHIEVIQENM